MEGFAQRPADQVVSWFWPLPHDPVAITKTGLACVSNLEGNRSRRSAGKGKRSVAPRVSGSPVAPSAWLSSRATAPGVAGFSATSPPCAPLAPRSWPSGRNTVPSYWERLGSLYVGAPSLDLDLDPEFVEQTIGFLRAMGHEALIPSDLAYLAKLRTLSGRTDLAVETIESAIRIVHNTGESLHLPELLRLRALYESQLIPEGGRRVADLLEALRVAQSQNSNLVALPRCHGPRQTSRVGSDPKTGNNI